MSNGNGNGNGNGNSNGNGNGNAFGLVDKLQDGTEGSRRDDTITGDTGDDTISGAAGHDSIVGDDGNDLLLGDLQDGVDEGVEATPLNLNINNLAYVSHEPLDDGDGGASVGDYAEYNNVATLIDGTVVSARLVLTELSDPNVEISLASHEGAEIFFESGQNGETASFRLEFYNQNTGEPVALNATTTFNDIDADSSSEVESIILDANSFVAYATSSDTSVSITTTDDSVVAAGTEKNSPDDQDAWFSAQFEDRTFIQFSLGARDSSSGFTLSGDLIDGGMFIPIEQGADTLIGGGGSDTIYGEGGDDVLDGGADNDEIWGGDGADSLLGGDGDDTLEGNEGADTISGGEGSDLIYGGAGDDVLSTGIGEDTLYGGDGNDTLLNSSGDDSMVGGAGDDLFIATAGNDTLEGGDGNDTLIGGADNDSILGEGGNDLIDGGTGNDFLDGGIDDDFIRGGIGNDTILGGDGNDILMGSDSSDSVATVISDDFDDVSAWDHYPIRSLANQHPYDANDTQGSPSGDSALVWTTTNQLFAGNYGGVWQSLPPDDLNVGETYKISFWAKTDGPDSQITVSYQSGSGGSHNFVSSTADVTDEWQYFEFTGTLDEVHDQFYIWGEDPNTTYAVDAIRFEQVSVGSDDDTIEGGDGLDTIYGLEGNDTIDGQAGADWLDGGAANDIIYVDQGDTAYGGDGDDVFILRDIDTSGSGNAGITITGGEGDETRGDTLVLTSDVSFSDITFSDQDPGTGMSGSFTMPDGTFVEFSEIEHIICFTSGTRILTASGERRIETLEVGDMVVTRDNGLQPVRWIGQRTVPARERFAPVRITPNVGLGSGNSLLVSPQHRILFTGYRSELLFGSPEVLVPAKHLIDGHAVTRQRSDIVTYVHLMFDQHEIIYAEGIATESFHAGDTALTALCDAAREELFALFPELRTAPLTGGKTVRPCLKRFEARLLDADQLCAS